MVGRDALFGECLLRCRGSLNTQGGGVKRFGRDVQRLTVAGLSEHGGSIIEACAKRADVAIRGIDVANEDVGLFVAKRGIGRRRIDEGNLKAHTACKGAGSVDRVAREVTIGALHGLRGIGSVEGDRKGTGSDQGIVRHRRGDGLALDLVDRWRRERGQRVECASAQTQYGDDRRGPSAQPSRVHQAAPHHVHYPAFCVVYNPCIARNIGLFLPADLVFDPTLAHRGVCSGGRSHLHDWPARPRGGIAPKKVERTVRLTSRTRHDRAARTRSLTWIPLTASVLD